jgi:hypothetical protein
VRIPEELVKPLAVLCVVCLVPLVSAAQSKQFDSKPLEITDVTVIDTTGAPSNPWSWKGTASRR